MALITNENDIIAGLAKAGSKKEITKNSVTSIAGGWVSLWTAPGWPGAGATPATGAGAAADGSTAGAIQIPSLAAGEDLFLGYGDFNSAAALTLVLYDRLVHTSGLSGIVTTPQAVNSAALSRYTTGDGVEAWLEWYTATGATGVNATCSYTNQAGTAGRTSGTIALPASVAAGRMYPFPLQSGDTGVRAVASVTLSATTGTAGNFGITLLRRLAKWTIPATGLGQLKNFFDLGLSSLQAQGASSPCLALLAMTNGTASGPVQGDLGFVVK